MRRSRSLEVGKGYEVYVFYISSDWVVSPCYDYREELRIKRGLSTNVRIVEDCQPSYASRMTNPR